MNTELAKELYELRYHEMAEDHYMNLLRKGLEFISNNPVDKVFINRFYKGEDLKAVHLALEYNEELMLRLLAS